MPFSEALKIQVKQKAAFRCCRCQVIDVEVHHIIPESEGGPSDFDNAAPLCPTCHAQFGDNPQKRKEIRQMRDWWYETCEKTYASPGPVNEGLLARIDSQLEQIKNGQTQILSELKTTLSGLTPMNIDSMTAGSAVVTASGIVNTVSAYQVNPEYFNYLIYKTCSNCGKFSESTTKVCPFCGSPM